MTATEGRRLAEDQDPLLWRLAAESDIRRVLATYCHGVDRADVDLLRSIYHDDAVDDHGGFYRGPATEFATTCVAEVRRLHAATMHFAGSALIEVHGTVAAVQSYVVAIHLLRKAPVVSWFGGRYLDRFEHRDGAWKIAYRRTIRDWDLGQPYETGMKPGWFENDGQRSTEDPSYGLFELVAAGDRWPADVG